MSEGPAFLDAAQVEHLHRISLERDGGQDGLRDRAAFESAVMHPRNVWHYSLGDLFDVAAAYAFHLAQAQAFLDGNKRAGMGAALVVLEGNGVTVPPASRELHEAMLAIADRRIGKTEVAALLRRLCQRV